MQDDNWELVNGPKAHEIEFLNLSSQINIIEAAVTFFTALAPEGQGPSTFCPNLNMLRELHRAGTLFLLTSPGDFRSDYNVILKDKDGVVFYEAPGWEAVGQLMEDFNNELQAMWVASDPVAVAAYALWRINWVHPFRNGNGRSARAFAYLCLCLKIGSFLPGQPTVLDQIMLNRLRCDAALRAADASFKETGVANLHEMRLFLMELLGTQLASAFAAPQQID